MHQMSLTESHTPVDEQRVVRFRRLLGHRLAGSVCELIAETYDEPVKRILRIQAGSVAVARSHERKLVSPEFRLFQAIPDQFTVVLGKPILVPLVGNPDKEFAPFGVALLKRGWPEPNIENLRRNTVLKE